MNKESTVQTITVVIPHFGNPEPTLKLIESLVAQQGNEVLQLVVVDDNSLVPFPDCRGVTVVRRPSNGGFGSAVNSGVLVAEHPLCLILNSDLEIGVHFVADLVRETMPLQPAVFSPQVLSPKGVPQWVGRHFPTIGHQVVEWLTPLARWRHLPALHEAVGHDTRCRTGVNIPVDWVIGAAMLLPTQAFRMVNGFDEGYFMNSEEIDLQRRLREHGVPAIFIGTVSVVHEGGGSSDPARRRQWLVTSRFRYARKWGHPSLLRGALRASSVINLVVNTGRQLGGRGIDARATFRQELSYLRRVKS